MIKTKIPPTTNNEIIEELSLEMGIAPAIIKDVIKSQSDFTVRIMKEGNLEGAEWPYFGRIKLKVGKIRLTNEFFSGKEVREKTIRPNDKVI